MPGVPHRIEAFGIPLSLIAGNACGTKASGKRSFKARHQHPLNRAFHHPKIGAFFNPI